MILNISLCPVVEQTGDGEHIEKTATDLGSATVEDLAMYIKKTADDHPLCVIKWEAEWPFIKISGEYRNDNECDSYMLLREEILHLLGEECTS